MTPETRLGVDVGGTFTDAALLDGDRLTTVKVPTTAEESVGVAEGIERACADAGIDPEEVDSFIHGTTVAVNTLLEGTGAKTALVTTAGFSDVLAIGRQDRPALYDLSARKPTPLVPRERRYGIEERATVEGIEEPIDEREVREVAREIDENEVESVAVCLLHSYAHPENETQIAELLREECAARVSVSHEVLAAFREYERTATTVADAYVTPKIASYLDRLETRATGLGVPSPRVMGSNGGVADAETVSANAVGTVLSGPAAGVVGAAATATPHADDLDGLVTFDMGGTSSDVSLVREGEAERTTDATVAGRPIGVPMVDISTVGAGGGSLARVDAGGALRVGPESAGADPGPACYGRGGTRPTVTDANLALGYIGADSAFGGSLELDAEAARDALSALASEADLDGPRAAARGVFRVANATMTRAIRSMTVERGHDPREFGLVAFGGAGPLHAAGLADALDIGTIVIPVSCGVLSAYGLLVANETHDAVRTHRVSLSDADPDTVESFYDALAGRVRGAASDSTTARIERTGECRYVGQSFELEIDVGTPFDPPELEARFHDAYETAYGYRMDDDVELVTLRASATVEREQTTRTYAAEGDAERGTRTAVFGDEPHETPVYAREALPPETELDGPAVLEATGSTVVIPPEWSGRVASDGALVLGRRADA